MIMAGKGSVGKPIGLMLLVLGLAAAPARAEPAGPDSSRWLMLVATKNMDAANEAAFNHWYDDIDIPDVLKVTGYQRARRGIRQTVPGFSTAEQEAADGRYVALYDIDTSNMDRTIIDMLMAAKKMDMTGRSIDALKVTERVYFRQLGGAVDVAAAPRKGGANFLYVERVDCCRDDATEIALNDWYDKTHLPDIVRAGVPGLKRITRFEVYRVVMVEPLRVPRFLTLYEFDSESAAQVVTAMRGLNESLKKSDRISDWFRESGNMVLKQIKDVRRQ